MTLTRPGTVSGPDDSRTRVWRARFVGPPLGSDDELPLLRREFELTDEVARANVHASALGVYELYINGEPVSDAVLEPGWTSYRHRLVFQTADVTRLLSRGANAIGAILGDGWYRGRLGFHGGRSNIYGDRLGLIVELEIEYKNGRREIVVSDEDWTTARGPIDSSSLYDGETYDARREIPGWTEPGFDSSGWTTVEALDVDPRILCEPLGPPTRRIEEIAPVAIRTGSSGGTIVDFGQNLAGRLRIRVEGPAGSTVQIRHAELLGLDGELCTRSLRTAAATDRYTLRGEGPEVWEPRFTYHGFRYAEIHGWPGEIDADSVLAVVCHADMERIGWFECSDPLLTRLHENAVWSMRGNFLSLPTDCPQRDERLAWTGDVQIFAPAASFLYDVRGFLGSWLRDVAAEQHPSGSVPHVVPDILPLLPDVPFAATGAAGWGDAAVIVPWVLYERYGDTTILKRQYDSMRGWVDYISTRTNAEHAWTGDFQFGDWLDPTAPLDRPEDGLTDPDLIATAYFARSARLLGQAAGALGRQQDEQRYSALAKEAERAFTSAYVTAAGHLSSDSQTAYCLALAFGLVAGDLSRRRAAARLAEIVRADHHHVGTGFLGTPLILDALSDNGYVDDAYALLLQRDCPSWLYQVTMGATTIWERWDSLLPDGSPNPAGMTSFNHFALGAVVDWLHRRVAGLAPGAPGYRRITVAPLVGGGLTWARARHVTPHGPAEVEWQLNGSYVELRVLVPENANATIALPGAREPVDVGPGEHNWRTRSARD